MRVHVPPCETVFSGGRFLRDAPRRLWGIHIFLRGFRMERPSKMGVRWRQFRTSEHRFSFHDGNSSILWPPVQTVAWFKALTDFLAIETHNHNNTILVLLTPTMSQARQVDDP